jgi:hypothetical protein
MLDISKIVKVYNGKIGCMCGCGGKYSYTQEGAVNHGPGYDVTDSINERSVKIIAKKVLTNPNNVYKDNFVYVEDKDRNRIQVIYFKD